MNWLRKLLRSSDEFEKEKIQQGLEKTKKRFFDNLSRALLGRSTLDDEILEALEEILITSDVGFTTTEKIIERVKKRVPKNKNTSFEEFTFLLKDEIRQLLRENNSKRLEDVEILAKPYVIMVVGVNGVGKTTTIGKLAYMFHQAGKKVVLGAADTFRAAAIEQLKVWANRVGVPLIKQQMGSDPASVAYDTLQSAVAQKADIVLIDTAGRLHNKQNLMQELAKIKRVMQKVLPEAPHEVLLVLDGSTGQNAFEQAKQFSQAISVTALAITKLDGTAKGGVVIGISDQLSIPIKYIGVGEKIDDLRLFDKDLFVESLFDQSSQKK